MESTNILEDVSQTLKNLGGQQGVKFEVSLDNESLLKIGVIMVLAVGFGVVANKLIDIA